MSTQSNTKRKISCKKCSVVKKAKVVEKGVQHLNLLLSYSYFIGESEPKAISVGFDSENFVPIVLLIGQTNLKLSCLAWTQLVQKLPEINNFMIRSINKPLLKFKSSRQGKIQKKFGISPTFEINVLIRKTTEKIIISQKSVLDKKFAQYFELSYREYINFFVYSGFISIVLDFLGPLSPLVQDYCELYLQECLKLKNVFVEKFFKPCITCPNLNYSRLFHEYPIIQADKIKQMIQDEDNKQSLSTKNEANSFTSIPDAVKEVHGTN